MINKLIGLLLVVFTLSCEQSVKPVEKTSLVVKFDKKADLLFYTYLSTAFSLPYFTQPVSEDGSFNVEDLQITEPIFGEVSIKNERFKLKTAPCYMTPGANMTITIEGNEISYEGDLKAENEFLAKFNSKLMREYYKGIKLKTSEPFHEFDKEIKAQLELIDQSKFDKGFKDYTKAWLNYRYDSIKYAILDNIDESEWTEEARTYISETANENFKTSALLGCLDWFYFLDRYFSVQKKFKNEDEGQYDNISNDFNQIQNDLIKERYALYMFDRMFSMREGLDGSGREKIALVQPFIHTKIGKQQMEQVMGKLDELEKNYAHLLPGKIAPKFEFENTNGEIVSLDDFKGNYVFLDVWNIYCGPCIKQIPYIRKYEEELKDKNIAFVSVTCDKQEEKQKWRDFVKRKNMVGHQLIMDNGRNSQFLMDYQIIGFPTFIIIDPEGKMVDYRFLMPENKDFMPTLLNIIES